MLKRVISKKRLKEIIPTINDKIVTKISIKRIDGTNDYYFKIGISKYKVRLISDDELNEIVKLIKEQ